jgi:hypothetical protein
MAAETFREWLVRQAESDPDYRMPYAVLYDALSAIPAGDIDLESWSEQFRADHDAEVSEALTTAVVKAQKVFLVDQLVYAQDPDLVPGNGESSKAVKVAPSQVSTTPAASRASPGEAAELVVTAAILSCGFRSIDGVLCGSVSVAGTARCVKHGGAISDADVRRSLIIQAYGRMIKGADTAVAALLEVAIDGRSEMARVQAAKELLDRVGMTVDAHPMLHEPPETDEDRRDAAIADLRDKIEDTRRRLKLVSIPAHSEVVIEAAEAS